MGVTAADLAQIPMSPDLGATLSRGYAIAHLDGGVIVRDAAQAPAGASVTVTVAEGSFAARSEGPVAEDVGAAS